MNNQVSLYYLKTSLHSGVKKIKENNDMKEH